MPSRPRWMSIAETGRVSLHEGRYAFPCDDPPCYLITFNRAEFGEIAGMDGEVAIVTVVFHTGGTANWEYLYVVGIRSGKPQVLAWMEKLAHAQTWVSGELSQIAGISFLKSMIPTSAWAIAVRPAQLPSAIAGRTVPFTKLASSFEPTTPRNSYLIHTVLILQNSNT